MKLPIRWRSPESVSYSMIWYGQFVYTIYEERLYLNYDVKKFPVYINHNPEQEKNRTEIAVGTLLNNLAHQGAFPGIREVTGRRMSSQKGVPNPDYSFRGAHGHEYYTADLFEPNVVTVDKIVTNTWNKSGQADVVMILLHPEYHRHISQDDVAQIGHHVLGTSGHSIEGIMVLHNGVLMSFKREKGALY